MVAFYKAIKLGRQNIQKLFLEQKLLNLPYILAYRSHHEFCVKKVEFGVDSQISRTANFGHTHCDLFLASLCIYR